MTIIPAIDLKDGKAVRLTKGEMQSSIVYGEASKFAMEFENMGAKWLHIVDLNGAFAGEPRNLKVIEEIRKSCNLKIELGGGIRNEYSIKRYLDLGIDRIILGSIALQDKEFTKAMAIKYPIAVGIDSKDGKVSVNGWTDVQDIDALDFARELRDYNIDSIICTDINRDGMLGGMNVEFVDSVARVSGVTTIASGGFSSIEDLELLLEYENISGVIVGKAFYEEKIDLKYVFKNY